MEQPVTEPTPPLTTAPLRGKELLRAAVNQILAHPETWDQRTWHCATTHCVGGWCQILGGLPPRNNYAEAEARELTGLNYKDAEWLFAVERTLTEINHFAVLYLADLDEDRDGYDRRGFDKAGYDRQGFNVDGRDRQGYDRAGYNTDGRDRRGYNRNGLDRQGYDCQGYNRDGYNRGGFDRRGRQLGPL